MNIKNLVNDAYAKDISAKERAAKRTAQKNGEYVGATAPYGYCCKKINGIYKLVKESESAKIVHRISDYNHYHHVYWQEGETLHQWGNSSVRAVLNRHN